MFVLAILLTACLVIAFKLFERFELNLFDAIVINYLTAFLCGLVVAGNPVAELQAGSPIVLIFGVVLGVLFIAVFNLLGISAVNAGISATSLANKMSLVFPVLLGLLFWGEPASLSIVIGLIFALISLLFITYKPNKSSLNSGNLKRFALPFVVFLGSGAIDSVMAISANRYVPQKSFGAFLVVLFGIAAICGITIKLVRVLKERKQIQLNAIIGGVLLGVVNYFSVWCFLEALSRNNLPTSVFYPLFNVMVVLVSIVASVSFFKERLSIVNWAGVLLAIAAIFMLQ